MAEPLRWDAIESDPEFQAIPLAQKEAVFNGWQNEVTGYLKSQGAPETDLQDFQKTAKERFTTTFVAPAVAADTATLFNLAQDPLDTQLLGQIRQREAAQPKLNAENEYARLSLELQQEGVKPYVEGDNVKANVAEFKPGQFEKIQRMQELRKSFTPEISGVEFPSEGPTMKNLFGATVAGQLDKELFQGFKDSSGAVAGGALGARMFTGARAGPVGALLPILGAIGGSMVGGAAQEKGTQLLETPEVTAARQQRQAQMAEGQDYKLGGLLAMGSVFRPSLSVMKAAVKGNEQAIQQIGVGGGLGAGMAAIQPAMEGRLPTPGEVAEGGLLGLAFHQPTRLARGLFGLHPMEFAPDPATQTVRTPIGTIDVQGKIVEPGTPEGTALRAVAGLDATKPTELQVSQDAKNLVEIIAARHTNEQGVTDWPTVRNVIEKLQPTQSTNPEFLGVMDDALRLADEQAPRTMEQEIAPDLAPERVVETPVEPAPVERVVEPAAPPTSEPPPPADVSGERVQPPWPNQDPVGIRNEFTEAERVRLGFPERDDPIARSFPQLHAEAEQAYARNPDVGRNLVDQLKAAPRITTGPEEAVLTFELGRQQKLVDRAYEEVNSAKTPEEMATAQENLSTQANRYQDILSVSELTGTGLSEAFYARRMRINEDFSLARMISKERALKDDPSVPLTPSEMAEVTKAHSEIKAAQEKVALLEAEKAEVQALKQVGREAKNAAKEKQGALGFLEAQAEAARQRIIARRGRLQTGDPLNIAGLVDEAIIGASHIARGVRDFAAWSKEMLGEFGERVRPHLQDLFARSQKIQQDSSKPFQKKTPQTPDERKLRNLEIRRDNLINGVKKPGPRLGPDTPEQALVRSQIEDLTSQIREAEKEIFNSPEARLERAKEASKGRISKLRDRLAAGDFERPTKREKVMDRELMKSLYQEHLLKEEWNNRATDKAWSDMSVWKKAKTIISDSPNIARILITSADGPAIFRQTLTSLTTPVRTAKAAWQSMRAMFSEEKRFEFQRDIATRHNAPLYEASGLRITRPNASPSKTEEQYMSRLINKLPKWTVVGPVARAAERSFTTYLNRYRADMFDAMHKMYKPGDYELKEMASVINDFTGSATLSEAAERAVPLMSKFFFAARKMVADVRVGTLYPLWKPSGTVKSRTYALENYARLVGSMGLILGMARAAGLYYETDPRNKHYGQVYVPGENGQPGVWHEAFGGPAKAFVVASRGISGQSKSDSGKVDSLIEPKYGGATVSETVGDFFANKMSPAFTNAKVIVNRREFGGKPVTPQSVAIRNTVPISYQQLKPIFERLGLPKGFTSQAFQFLGGGAQPAMKKPKGAK